MYSTRSANIKKNYQTVQYLYDRLKKGGQSSPFNPGQIAARDLNLLNI